jgi:hypothetical protein
MSIQLVFAEFAGGEQVPDPGGAGIGGAPARPWLAAGFLVVAVDRRPLPPRMRLEVQRPELIHTEDRLRLARPGDDLTVSDGIHMLDPGLLHRVVWVFGCLPGFQPLKGDALLAEQHAQARVADAAATPSATRNSPASAGSKWKTAGHARPGETWRSS